MTTSDPDFQAKIDAAVEANARDERVQEIARHLSALAEEYRQEGNEVRATQLMDAAILLVGPEYA